MYYYVMQIQTGLEKQFMQTAGGINWENKLQVLWPRRSIQIRRRGKWITSQPSIFPGYLFIEAGEVYRPLFNQLRYIKGFIRFLNSNNVIIPLDGQDRDILLHFLGFGEVAGKSVVSFDENNRIVVQSGPLKGLEGNIVKVDRRKKRAKVKLQMYQDSFLIDFGFEALDVARQTASANSNN